MLSKLCLVSHQAGVLWLQIVFVWLGIRFLGLSLCKGGGRNYGANGVIIWDSLG